MTPGPGGSSPGPVVLGANVGAFLEGRAQRIALMGSGQAAKALFDDTIHGTLTDPEAIARAIEERRPDVVLHAAAMASHEACETDPAWAEQVNATATGVLAAAASAAGSQFVYISTSAVFDGQQAGYTEIDEPSPASV